MKGKILIKIIFLIVLLLNINFVYAKSLPSKSDTINISNNNITSVVNIKDMIVMSHDNKTNTVLNTYDNNLNLKGTKMIDSLTSSKLIKNNEHFILVGVMANTLKFYELDENLKIIEQKDTSYIVPINSEVNVYSYNNKFYVMLTLDKSLISNEIYEVDEKFNVTLNRFSNYNAQDLRNILKSDYYLIHNNSQVKEGKEIHYNGSTYLENLNVLVGYTYNLLDNSKMSYITLIDDKGNKIKEESNEKYLEYKDIYVINSNIVFIGVDKNNNSFLITLNNKGDILEEKRLNNNSSIYKAANKFFISDDNTISVYTYDLRIIKEEDKYGTIIINENVVPNEIVSYNVIANSGFKVKEVIIKDNQGNVIKTDNNQFIMPENDCRIKVIYEEAIVNPETFDFILIAVPFLIIILIVAYNLYRKMMWLR